MNPNTIPWLHYQDIQISDVAVRQQFNQYMMNGQYSEAISLLNNNEEQLQGKAFIADTIVKITSGIIDLQDRFNNGVNLFLSNLASQYMTMVGNLKNMGTWNASVQYYPYNFVIYQNEIYMTIDTPPLATLPTNTTYWLYLNIRGEQGAPGTDVIMRYNWNDFRTYQLNDLVVYNNNIYVALRENTNVVPGTSADDWLVFISITAGGINVGVNPPSEAVFNTVWFKTDINPLTATGTNGVIGQLYFYNQLNEWEELYPETIFTWIADKEDYAPLIKTEQITINTNDWIFSNNLYTYTYTNPLILANSYIEIYSQNQVSFYNFLNVQINTGNLILTTTMEPTNSLDIIIVIQ